MSAILDIVVVLIVLSLAFTSFRRGLINSLVDFVGTIVAVVASSFVASSVSIWIYNQFIMSKITDSVNQALLSLPESATATQQAENIISSLPSYASNALTMLGIDSDNLFSSINTDILSIPQAVESLVRPTAVKIITTILTVILFILFMVLIGFVSKLVTKAVNIVGLSPVNKIGGAIFGAVKGLLIIMILSFLLYFVMMFLPSETSIELNEAIENSYLYYGIYNISLPEKIISLFTVK